MKIADIKIGARFRKSIGSLSSLVASIKEVGLLHPIVVSEKGELIAGVRRIEAAKLLGWTEIPVTVVNLSDLRKGEVQENLARKDFTYSEMVAVKRVLESEVKAEHPIGRPEKGGNFPQLTGEKTRDILGSYVGVSGKTLEKAELVVEASEQHPEQFGALVSKMDAGKISVNAAATQVRRAQKHTNTPNLPEGEYDVIYADPPWKYEFCLEGPADDHYAEMDTSKICDLSVPTAKDAILFLWATNPKIEDALKVLKAWGFQYITNLVWVKQTKGLGYYSLAQHELLFICKKGNIPPPQAENRPLSVIQADRTNHSHKPKVFYEIIEKMYPNRKYLELFATESREGWVSWGNQLAEKQ